MKTLGKILAGLGALVVVGKVALVINHEIDVKRREKRDKEDCERMTASLKRHIEEERRKEEEIAKDRKEAIEKEKADQEERFAEMEAKFKEVIPTENEIKAVPITEVIDTLFE